MKKHLVLLSAVLLMQAAVVSVFAQQKPKAGDLISGIVTDSVSPLMGVYITELDSREEPKGMHEYVDLGLSVKWATCNVGADKPEDFGNYYAWGETETKDVYDWSSYKWCNGSSDTLTKYNPFKVQGIVDSISTLDPNDDVAHVKWGGSWRMPTASEFRELMDNCKWTWKSVNGINGYVVRSRIKGYRDRSIFLPAAGYCYDKKLSSAGEVAYYWSNSLFDFPISAKSILLSSDDFCRHYCSRFVGNPVRPVHP